MNVHSVEKALALEDYRQQFSESAGYLDFARIGPLSAVVADQKVANIDRMKTAGPSVLGHLDNLVDKARAAASTLLEAKHHEVAFVGSTSHGMFAAAQALSPQTGTVLVPLNDFPANTYPWIRAAERGGLAVRWIDGPVTAESVRDALDSSVKAVAVSAVDAGTGFLAPLAQIKEVIGADRVLAVDAVQAFGAVPFDVEAADILAAGGQKWLRAGWGAAALLVRDRVADKLLPGLGGWSGVMDPLGPGELPHPALPGALAHTVTNPDSIAVASYGAAVDLVIATGLNEINAAIRGNLDSLLEVILEAGGETRNPSPQSGIAAFRMPGVDPAELFDRLEHSGIHSTRRGDWIRISPHATTSQASVDMLTDTLASLGLARSR